MIYLYLFISLFSLTQLVALAVAYIGTCIVLNGENARGLDMKGSTTGISLWVVAVFAISTTMLIKEMGIL